jgi:hypothetical protein
MMTIMGLFLREVISSSPAPCGHSSRPPIARETASSLLAATTLAVTLLLPNPSHALGFGRLAGEPVIGEALQLELPLTGTVDRPLDAGCVSVYRPTNAIDADYFPRDLNVRVDPQAGTPRLLLTTRSALRQPLVEFRVAISCGYNLTHDYMLMAAPRSAQAEAPVVASAVPTTSAPAAAGPATGPLAAPETTGVALPSSGGTQLPDGMAGRDLVLKKSMTLESLARLHFPGPLRQQRFMRWVAEANPQYFAGARNLRRHKLEGGTQLVIPAGVPPRRPGDHQGNVTPLGERIPAASTEVHAPVPERKPPRQQQPVEAILPRIASEGSKDRLVVGGSGNTAKNFKEAMGLVDRLTGMIEQQVSAQTAYNDKIQQLETTVGDLGKQIRKLESEARQRDAQWQAERQAEKNAREQQAERNWWQLLAAVAIGGIVGALLLQGLGMLFRRKRESTESIDNIPADQPADEQLSPKSGGPLTEFGLEEESRAAAASTTVPDGNRTATASPRSVSASIPETAPAAPAGTGSRTETVQSHQINFEPPAPGRLQAAAAVGGSLETASSQPSDPATAAIELANIMTSMGLTDSAAKTLVEHIRENPRESLQHWLKLLELHRLNGNRAEFERSADEMRQHFNVQADDWAAGSARGRTSLENYPHIRSHVVKLWPRPECATLLQSLLMDNREGTRVGFPLPVAEEILLLIAILNSSR